MNNASINSASICTTVDTQQNLALEQKMNISFYFCHYIVHIKKQAFIVLIL